MFLLSPFALPSSGLYILPLQWLTTHLVSTEHNLHADLRNNFDPHAKWHSAIASARAIGRFAKSGMNSSSGSNGWKSGGTGEIIMDEDEDKEEGEMRHESENKYVKIPIPALEQRSPASVVLDTLAQGCAQHQAGVAHGTQHAAVNRLWERLPMLTLKTPKTPESPTLHDEPESMLGSSDEQEEEEEEPKMPGSFDLSGPPIRRPGGGTPSPLSSALISPLSPSSWMVMIKNLAV